jgi:predicted permease
VRTFLARFFENEVTAGAHDLKASLFWLIALLAMPGAIAPALIALASMPPSGPHPDPSTWGWAMIARYEGVEVLRVLSRADKTLYLGFAMVASAILSAITWGSVLPERRDALVLGVLPVRPSKVIGAKLIAVGIYVMFVSVAMHALASISFGFFLAAENTIGFGLRGVAAHFVASCAASAFVCFVVIALQGLALVVVGPRRFARVSAVMQAVLVGTVIVGLVTLPAVSSSVVDSLAGHGVHARPWILNTPPLWFLGIYESVIGAPGATLHQLASNAWGALGAALLVILIAYPLACRRLLADAVENPGGFGRVGRFALFPRLIAQFAGRSQDVRAVAQFYLATIGRVGQHRFVIAMAVGVAAAWSLPAWMSLASELPAAPTTDLLSLPIAAMFFLLVGLRVAAALPSDLPSSWPFEAHAPSRQRIRQALERTMFIVAVLPVTAISVAVYWYLWGREIAVLHAACALAIGAALTEIILWRFEGMPCSAPWKPPSGHLRKWWPAYLVVLAFITRGLPTLERFALMASHWALVLTVWMLWMARLARTHSLAPRPVRDGESAELLTSALRVGRGAGELADEGRVEVRGADRTLARRPLFEFLNTPAGDERWYDEFSMRPRDVWRDLRLGWRRLRQAAGFATFSIVTLALGIGTTTAAYSVMYDFIWRPLGVPASESIVVLRKNVYPLRPALVSWPDFRDLHSRLIPLGPVAAWGPVYSSLAANNRAELVTGQAVTGRFFQVFGVTPALGRMIQPEDDQPGAPFVVVLSHTIWRKQLGADPAIVGRSVKLGDQPFQVVGVAPASFRGSQIGRQQALWVPLNAAPALARWLGPRNDPEDRDSAWLTVVARLRPEVARSTASAGVQTLGEQLDAASPLRPTSDVERSAARRPNPRSWRLMSLVDESSLRSGSRLGIIIVALPVLVLLVACTNLANLVLSRGASRRHEFAVRRALGASRWGLMRELLVEVGTIALVGGVGGLLVTRSLLTYFLTTVQEKFGYQPALQLDPHVEPAVFAVAAVAVFVALFVAGFVPALQLTGGKNVRGALASDTAAGSLPGWRGRRRLIMLQVAVSVGLFLIATVLFRQIGVEQRAAGPDLDGISVATIPFDLQQREASRVHETVDGVLSELRSTPSVEAAATTLFQNRASTIVNLETESAEFIIGTSGLFRTLGVPMRFGRTFDDRDVMSGPPSVIINESLARKLFGTADVAGRQALMRFTWVRLGLIDARTLPAETVTVVGVVSDRTTSSSERVEAEVYAPLAQRDAFDVGILARSSSGRSGDLGTTLRSAIRKVDPELAVSYAGRLDVLLGGPAAVLGMIVAVAGSLASLALVLVMVGLYGVLSHVMGRRTREMGLRIALGAERWHIMQIVFADGLRPVAAGLALGLGVAIVSRGILQASFTNTLSSIDLLACAFAIAPLLVATCAACYLPARRAARVDPNVTLRHL